MFVWLSPASPDFRASIQETGAATATRSHWHGGSITSASRDKAAHAPLSTVSPATPWTATRAVVTGHSKEVTCLAWLQHLLCLNVSVSLVTWVPAPSYLQSGGLVKQKLC